MILKISFIVPVYKYASTLERCLTSIPRENEVIVVGRDIAPDSRSVLDKHPGVTFIETDVPGAAHARNLGAGAAKGDYLAFLDADTYLPEGFRPPANLADYDIFAYTIEYSSAENGSLHHYLEKRKTLTNRFNFATVMRGYFLYLDTAFAIFEKKYFLANAGFAAELLRFEDRDFGYRAQLAGARLCLLKNPCPVKVLDETAPELFQKKILDVYWQSKAIFTTYSSFLQYIQETNPFRIFKDELRLIFYLNVPGKPVQFLYIFTEFATALLFKFYFTLKRRTSNGKTAHSSEQSCLITCESKSVFKSY